MEVSSGFSKRNDRSSASADDVLDHRIGMTDDRSAMPAHQLLQRSERDSFLQELKVQNDLILSEHKKLLDIQFQEQMRSMMGTLQGELKRSKSDFVGSSAEQHRPVSIPELERSNERFFQAARRTHTAPQFNLYDGNNERSAVVRASSTDEYRVPSTSFSLKTSTTYNNSSSTITTSSNNNSSSSGGRDGSRAKSSSSKRHKETPYPGDDQDPPVPPRSTKANPSGVSSGVTGMSRQLQSIYGSKSGSGSDLGSGARFGFPNLNQSFPNGRGSRDSPTFPTLLGSTDKGSTDKSKDDDSAYRKLDPCMRDFLSKTESLLVDARKIKKKKKKIPEREEREAEEEQYKDDFSDNYGNQENRVNFSVDLNASISLPVISERRAFTPHTPHNNTHSNRAHTPFTPDKARTPHTPSSPSHGSKFKNSGNNDTQNLSGTIPDTAMDSTAAGDEYERQKLKELGWTGKAYEEHSEGVEEHSPKNASSHTTTEWQNELARHILSMYATTTANTNMSNSKAILEFVDDTRGTSIDSLSRDLGRRRSKGRVNTANTASRGNTAASDASGGGVGGLEDGGSLKSDLSSLRSDPKSSKPDLKSVRERKNKDNITVIRDFSVISDPSRGGSLDVSAAPSRHGSGYRKTRSGGGMGVGGVSLSSTGLTALSGTQGTNRTRTANNTTANERLVNGEAYLRLTGPPRCFPVWFVGTGDVYSDWSPLMPHLEGAKLQAQLRVMYEHKEFREYLGVVETLLVRFLKDLTAQEAWARARGGKLYAPEDSSSSPSPQGSTDEESRLLGERKKLLVFWLQLVTTAVAMASLSIDSKQFDLALNILQRAQEWSTRDDILTPRQCQSCRAHVYDTYSYFFFRRKKLTAALHHAELAKNIHMRLDNYDGLAGTLLHISAIQCQYSRHTEAHKTLYHFLAMVEDGRLEFRSASPTELCLVAVGYHNLAVIQIKLQASDLACKTSQNARKIARLCLSASTRYLAVFQRTHEAALADLKYHMEYRPVAAGYDSEIAAYDNHKFDVVNRLVESLFNTLADVDSAVP